jgi:hypothetical protein
MQTTTTFTAPISEVTGRTLFRYVFRGHAGRFRTCERWMEDQSEAETDALEVAKEWGTAKRALKVELVYPVPTMPHSLHAAAGAP